MTGFNKMKKLMLYCFGIFFLMYALVISGCSYTIQERNSVKEHPIQSRFVEKEHTDTSTETPDTHIIPVQQGENSVVERKNNPPVADFL